MTAKSPQLKLGIDGVPERLGYIQLHLDLAKSAERVPEKTAFLGSAMFWLSAADSLLQEANPTRTADQHSYRARRNNEPGGRTVAGLCLARHEVAHGSAFVISQGLAFPMRYPINFGGIFIPADKLSDSYAARDRKIRPRDLESFEKHVAGRSGIDALEEAFEWIRQFK